MNQTTHTTGKSQQGAATLMVALVILISLTLLTFLAAKVSVTEHKISANEYRSKQAQEVAQGGMEFVHAYITANLGSNDMSAVDNAATTTLPTICTQTTSFNGQTFTANCGGTFNGAADPARNANGFTTITFAGSSTYTLTLRNVTANNFTRLQITATGVSDDGSASKTITQLLAVSPGITLGTNAALLAQSDVNIGSNASTFSNTTGSGTAITYGGSLSPKGTITGGTFNDPSLSAMSSDAFFQKIFGDTPANIKAKAIVCTLSTLPADLNGKIIWITDGGVSHAVFGTTTNPSIVITEGDLKLNGGGTVIGLMYYRGAGGSNGSGSSTFDGAVVSEGTYNTTGNMDVTYNPAVLSKLPGQTPSFAKVTGGWRDF